MQINGFGSWVESWELMLVESWELRVELCWRRLLRVLWTARRSNQSILREISPECSLEVPMLKLKPILWPPDAKNSLEKILMLGKIKGKRRRRWQRMRWLDASPAWWTWVWASFKSWWWTGKPGVLQSMGSQRGRHNWATELNWRLLCPCRDHLWVCISWSPLLSPMCQMTCLTEPHY